MRLLIANDENSTQTRFCEKDYRVTQGIGVKVMLLTLGMVALGFIDILPCSWPPSHTLPRRWHNGPRCSICMWPSMFIVIEKGQLPLVTRVMGTLRLFQSGEGDHS